MDNNTNNTNNTSTNNNTGTNINNINPNMVSLTIDEFNNLMQQKNIPYTGFINVYYPNTSFSFMLNIPKKI
jgi:hypothetical protein